MIKLKKGEEKADVKIQPLPKKPFFIRAAGKLKRTVKKFFKFLGIFLSAGSRDEEISAKQQRLFKGFAIFLFVAAIIVFIAVFAVKVYNTGNRETLFKENAAKVCSDIIADAGSSRIEYVYDENNENSWNMLGLSCVRRIDFNADGRDELLVSYFKGGKYYVEVWGSKGRDFVNFYKEEANSLDAYTQLGSWLTIYNSGGKYYIGQFNSGEEENMDLLALHGDTFEADETCRFDPAEECYVIDEKINNIDFETIQFSALTSAKAEYQLGSVQDNLLQFIGSKNSENEQPKTDAQKKASVYSKVIDSKIQKYGAPQYSSSGSSCYADGVAVAALVDFNGDNNEELLIISRNKKDYNDTDASPKYVTEIFSWNGSVAVKAYEGETTSTYFDNDKTDVFYILQKANGKTNLCFNQYFYGEDPEISWKAISTILEMNSPEKFEPAFTAYKRNNYNYYSYKLNGEYASKSTFEETGYAVPYFCNDDEYNEQEFAITVLKGDESKKAEIEKLIADTEEAIKQLNNSIAYSE